MITPGLLGAVPLLACPVCTEPLRPDAGSLRCPHGHCFDVSKKGYVNLSRSHAPSGYDRPMLTARRRLGEAGLWGGLLERLAVLCAELPLRGPVLDAGCGEGYQLTRFMGLSGCAGPAVGMDLSKDAVALAAAGSPDLCWVVGDLAAPAFRGGAFGLILNILSPANYRAFAGLLAPGGVLVKAVPGEDHLRELREALFSDSRRDYSPERVLRRFSERFRTAACESVRYTVTVPGGLLPAFVAMTPMSWNAGEDARRAVCALSALEVTVELQLLAGVASD